MAGRIGGLALGAAAMCAAAVALVPPLQQLPAHLTIDIGAQTGGGTIWTLASAAPSAVALEIVEMPALRRVARPGLESVRLAEQRLRSAITPEMAKHFRLFLYVDKSAHGALAQRMFVFENRAAGFRLRHVWLVSTGRERLERDATGRRALTGTPAGYYELDPARFYRHYVSVHWNEPMPYAMFFGRMENGVKTGLAIHGAAGREQASLGTRASAGCVRLAPKNARRLFELIHEAYKGPVPALAFDPHSRSSSLGGVFARGEDGKVTLISGYQVLVLIDQHESGKQMTALL